MTEQKYKIRIKRGEIEIEAEGDKEFVEKHIEEFKKELSKIAKGLPPTEKDIASQIPEEKIGVENLSLAEFYKQKNPNTDEEAVLTVAYYLEFHDRQDEFTNKQIKEATDKIGHKITNIAHTLKVAARGKKAYLLKGSKGLWKITSEGKRFVEEKLPHKEGEK